MSFTDRASKASEATEAFRAVLRRLHIPFAECGYEHLPGEFDFKHKITSFTDETSARIRFWPDFIVLIRHSYLFEVKYSTGIEREAYEMYRQLNVIGYNVALAFWRNQEFLVCRPDALVFEVPNPAVYGMSVPVADGVWRTPRNLPRQEYHEYLRRAKAKGQNTSGCAFAFVDFAKTPFKNLEYVLTAFAPKRVA